MRHFRIGLPVALLFFGAAVADQPAGRTAMDALRPFNDLIGSWRAAGTPEGTREEKQRGFWTESISWSWQFKGQDVALKALVEKGKHFTQMELRFLPDKDRYRLTLTTPDKKVLDFDGSLKDNVLTVERAEEANKET